MKDKKKRKTRRGGSSFSRLFHIKVPTTLRNAFSKPRPVELPPATPLHSRSTYSPKRSTSPSGHHHHMPYLAKKPSDVVFIHHDELVYFTEKECKAYNIVHHYIEKTDQKHLHIKVDMGDMEYAFIASNAQIYFYPTPDYLLKTHHIHGAHGNAYATIDTSKKPTETQINTYEAIDLDENGNLLANI
jgi:hypothetical protein